MTRVFGTLFDDGRSGTLVIKPSQPFFGVVRHERHYPVSEGSIDINLSPTPRGVYYHIGFKEAGDFNRTDFTRRWSIPDQPEICIEANDGSNQSAKASSTISRSYDQVQARRLTTELGDAYELISSLELSVYGWSERYQKLSDQFESYRSATESTSQSKDIEISRLSQLYKNPTENIVYESVAVPDKQLLSRIDFLEAELIQLKDLSEEYYKSVVELHQLKLERAKSITPPSPVEEVESSPRQRLINKLLAR